MTAASIERVSSDAQISEVARLAETIWNQHFVSIIGQQQVDYMLAKFQSAKAIRAQIDSGYEYYLALQDGALAGYMAVVADETPGKLMLSKIYVLKDARGSGVGEQLLQFAKQRTVEMGAGVLWLTVNRNNEAAINWYRKRGFRVTREAKADIGQGFYMDDYIMQYEQR